MLKTTVLDRVEIRKSIKDNKEYHLLLGLLKDLAENTGKKCKSGKKGKAYVRHLDIPLDGVLLNVTVIGCFGQYSVGYGFKGSINADLCEKATEMLGEYSFFWVVNNGRVVRLELAADYADMKAEDVMVHMHGVRSGRMITNDKDFGRTYYVGSRYSAEQLVSYDKARELQSKKEPCQFKDLLRIELRFLGSAYSLEKLVTKSLYLDPFDDVLIIPFGDALSSPSAISNWGIFLGACRLEGVPTALRLFSSHRKTFLGKLEQLASSTMRPVFWMFLDQIKSIIPYSIIWGHISYPKTEFPDAEGELPLHSIAKV